MGTGHHACGSKHLFSLMRIIISAHVLILSSYIMSVNWCVCMCACVCVCVWGGGGDASDDFVFIAIYMLNYQYENHPRTSGEQCTCINFFFITTMHSKNTRVRNWPGKGPLGPNSIPSQWWPGNQSTWHGMWPRAGSIWPHYLSSLQKADQFPGHRWPGMEFGPQWTLFRVTLTRVF